jgi:hypothetical protein
MQKNINFFWHFEIYFLGRGSICTREPNWIHDPSFCSIVHMDFITEIVLWCPPQRAGYPLVSKNDRVSKISIIKIFMLRLKSEINYADCSTSVVDQQTFKSLIWCLRVTKWETSRKWNALACGTRPNYSFIISTWLQLSPQQMEPLETCSMPFV